MSSGDLHYTSSHHSRNAEFREDYNDVGGGDIEINVEDYLRAVRHPVQVTRKNKIVCTVAFAVLIITVLGYVAGLAYHHATNASDIMKDLHFKGPANIIYFLMSSDAVASTVGIWTCLKKTGPQPMIYACIWLLLSSLINLCVTISLTFETKAYREEKARRCKNRDSDDCWMYTKLTVLLWCSLLFFVLKILVIVLCRLNYPQVFNWLMGKDVYVDEELVSELNRRSISNPKAIIAGPYFDPPDLARIAARGSIQNTAIIGTLSNSQGIFVTKEKEGQGEMGKLQTIGEWNSGRRPDSPSKTFISL